ncbi:MAG: hypothetical protein QJR04_25365 [Burkholderia multivorans]|nr:hypothetical protein [Burkholderia multivorans]
MDTFSLLTGIASGVAASLICQRVVIELRSQRAEKAQRLTVRFDNFDRRIRTIEHQIAALEGFRERLKAVEGKVAQRSTANQEKLDAFAKRRDVHDQRMMQDEVIHAEFAHNIGARLHELEAKLSGISDVMRGAQHAQD